MHRRVCIFILKLVSFLDFWSAGLATRPGVVTLFPVHLLSDFSFIFSSWCRSQQVVCASDHNLQLTCQIRQVSPTPPIPSPLWQHHASSVSKKAQEESPDSFKSLPKHVSVNLTFVKNGSYHLQVTRGLGQVLGWHLRQLGTYHCHQ